MTISAFLILSALPAKSAVGILSSLQNHILRGRIQHRAATDRFAECLTEMAQTGVADFDCRFGHIKSAAAQKLGRAFHPNIAEILRNGQTYFARKNPA